MQFCKNNMLTFYISSKFNYVKLKFLPSLNLLISTISHLGKIKSYYILFFLLILNILFFSHVIHSSRSEITKQFIRISIISHGPNRILCFLKTFIYFYFPLIDCSISEITINKMTSNCIYFTLPKFPSINEIDLFLQNIESLASFFYYTKMNFIVVFRSCKSKFDCLTFLNFLKLPLLRK